MTTLTIFIKMEYRFILPVLSYFFITDSFIYSIFPVLFFIGTLQGTCGTVSHFSAGLLALFVFLCTCGRALSARYAHASTHRHQSQ